MEYHFSDIEEFCANYWEQEKVYQIENCFTKPKYYVLDMFPYPSGSGLHVGHPLGYVASDIYARYKRLKGFQVLHPMGFDAFGLPAEQYALETGKHPADTTRENINRYKAQLKRIGLSYDWSREVVTSDPKYYKWTQWIFLQLFQSFYDQKKNKARPIQELIDEFSIYGSHTDRINRNTGMISFSSEEWNQYDEIKKQNILMNFRLAYKAESTVNWCEQLGTVLANDEVINGVSERGGFPVEKKKMSQWFLRITDYADRLLQGLDNLDFPPSLKDMQQNWIGKSKGCNLFFETENKSHRIKVFTTRPDTIFGVSFLVLAPEHEWAIELCTEEQKKPVGEYIKKAGVKSERERLANVKNVSGCFTGTYALHPLTGEKIPVWIADYVLAGYGTGAIMAVPAGDSRDFAFALHFDLPIPQIFDGVSDEQACEDKQAVLCNSDFLDGKQYKDAFPIIIKKIVEADIGDIQTNYRMRDAGFSRQRYWGEPFPVLFDDRGIIHIDHDLPLELPHVESYTNGKEGKGPLSNITDWIQTNQLIRESDTMPGYAGSSWYYLRYMDPHNESEFCDRKISDYWNQVDVYVGGAEHAVGHLLYSRMWCKVLYDLNFISFEEPYKKLINQGMIQGSSRLVYRISGKNEFITEELKNNYETEAIHVDVSLVDGVELNISKFKAWRDEYQNATFILNRENKYICGAVTEKMSKRLYNVVNPDDIVDRYGADTFRMYEMFLGPIEDSKPWDTKGIEGVYRFLKKFWNLFHPNDTFNLSDEKANKDELKVLHRHIKKIDEDLERFSLNTCVSQFMICLNELSSFKCNKKEILKPLLITLAPFAPHIAEYLWQKSGETNSIVLASFPSFDSSVLTESTFSYPVAINGKVRTEISFDQHISQEEIEKEVLENEVVKKWTEGKQVRKFIFVKGRMINIAVS